MKKIDYTLVEEAKQYVSVLLTSELSDKCLFHTINHTLEVLNNAEVIATYCNLNGEELNLLRMAALFHDVGYVDSYDDHESYSAKRAREYLEIRMDDEQSISQIERAILSTKIPQSPEDKISKMLCDADLMNLTFDDYFEQIDLMRMEWEQVGNTKISRQQVYINTLEFFQSHQYHSRYGKEILQPKKEQTERKIKDKVIVNK
jgi:putative nucleotidyltransferase with HDIG domain